MYLYLLFILIFTFVLQSLQYPLISSSVPQTVMIKKKNLVCFFIFLHKFLFAPPLKKLLLFNQYHAYKMGPFSQVWRTLFHTLVKNLFFFFVVILCCTKLCMQVVYKESTFYTHTYIILQILPFKLVRETVVFIVLICHFQFRRAHLYSYLVKYPAYM